MIEDFREVRRDGLVIAEDMSLDLIVGLGPPSPIVELRWIGAGAPVVVAQPLGGLAQVARDRLHVVQLDGRDDGRVLKVLDERGGTVHAIAPKIGRFGWFEEPRSSAPTVVGVVVVDERGGDRLEDIDLATGEVLLSTELR